ncbi:MAG: MFS transporter [Actinomycetota bacterium]
MSRPRLSRSGFALVCGAYLAVTVGEATLTPVYPAAAADLGLDVDDAGTAFAVLAFSLGSASLVGGVLLRWWTTTRVMTAALLLTAAGGAVAAAATGTGTFLAGQVGLGAGAGMLYPPAVISIAALAGERRRGLAMGAFGSFFSLGLVAAAGLSAAADATSWRMPFVVGAVLAVGAAAALRRVQGDRVAGESSSLSAVRGVLGAASAVGAVGGVAQYAAVAYLPVFAVAEWGVSAADAALILLVGRVLSFPAKLLAGATADRFGAVAAARLVGVLLGCCGLVWSLAPSTQLGVVMAVVFTGTVSAVFPLANLLAYESAGPDGVALGLFRALQLAAGGLVAVGIAAAAQWADLRPTIAVAAGLPVVLVAIRDRRSSVGSGLRATGTDVSVAAPRAS